VDYLEWRRSGGPPVAVSSPRWPVREVADAGADWVADAKARGVSRRIEATHDGGQTGRSLFASPSGTLLVGTFEPPAEAEPIGSSDAATSAYDDAESRALLARGHPILLFLLLAFVVLLAASGSASSSRGA